MQNYGFVASAKTFSLLQLSIKSTHREFLTINARLFGGEKKQGVSLLITVSWSP